MALMKISGNQTRWLASFTVLLLSSATLFGQTNAAPTHTQCKQWDDNYLFLFNIFLAVALALPTALNTSLPPVLGRRFWWLAAPRSRVLGWAVIAVFLSVIFLALPTMTGFGGFIFSGIGQQYFDCQTQKFNAAGLLFGLIGSGVPGIAQWPLILTLLTSGSIVGGLIALVISSILVRRVGLPSRVRGTVS